jgi:cell volume regulation protein A
MAMVDDKANYMLSFNDFQEKSAHSFLKMTIEAGHPWVGVPVHALGLGTGVLIVAIKRGSGTVAPRGDTVIEAGDVLVLSGEAFQEDSHTEVQLVSIAEDNSWAGRLIKELDIPANTLIVSIEREDGSVLTPKGWVRINAGDTVGLLSWDE